MIPGINYQSQTNGQTGGNFTGDNFDYSAFGEQESAKVDGDPKVLENFLYMFYDQDSKTSDCRRDMHELLAENEKLNGEIANYQGSVDDIRRSIQMYVDERDQFGMNIQRDIHVHHATIKKIRGGDYATLRDDSHPANRLGFWLGVIILALLSLYLINFYSSVLYNAFLLDPYKLATQNVKEKLVQSVTVVNLRAFYDTYRGFGTLGVVFLFTGTFVFIGLGFLLHWFIKMQNRIWPIALYVFTFLFDGLLAYEVVRKIHLSYSYSNESDPWRWQMAFQNAEFYIILLGGFGMYVAWGLLLRYVLEEYHKILPAIIEIRKNKAEISRLKKDLKKTMETMNGKIHYLKTEQDSIRRRDIDFRQARINSNSNNVKDLRAKMRTHLQQTKKNAQQLRTIVTLFLSGWCKFIRQKYDHTQQADDRVNACHDVVEKFYQTTGI